MSSPYKITPFQKEVGAQFKRFRQNRQISIDDAAELVGLTPEKFFKFENGTQFVRQNVINKLIRAYKLPEKYKSYVGFFEPPLERKSKKANPLIETAVYDNEYVT